MMRFMYILPDYAFHLIKISLVPTSGTSFVYKKNKADQ